MQLREELEELQDSADLAGVATFKRRLKAAQAELEREFAACWDDAQRREEAERLVRRMQFLDKLGAGSAPAGRATRRLIPAAPGRTHS